MTTRLHKTATNCLIGGGEMGERIREFDWSKTSLGPITQWPQSLKTAVCIMLGCQYPLLIWWGEELIHFYNDAYTPVLGMRHPNALGRSAPQVWSEVWPQVGPQADAVMQEGKSHWNEELLIITTRNGYPEEVYFTFSFGPILDDAGKVGGVFCACTEETQRVLSRRRLATLRALADRSYQSKSVKEACEIAAAELAHNTNDLPFTLIYLLGADGRCAHLHGQSGLNDITAANPIKIEIDSTDEPWQFQHVMTIGKALLITELEKKLERLPGGPWPEPTEKALVLPLIKADQQKLTGFLVAGISPRLTLDDNYHGFLDLVATQVATAIANARAYEEERQRAEALAEIDRAKTTFFSNVSHEFRTPLTLILSPLEEILAEKKNSQEQKQLELMHRNALRLQKLVNTLLDFSRIEAGRMQASYEPIAFAELTAELASVFRSAIEKAGIQFIVDSKTLDEKVYVDRDMYEKIVLNLLSNAFKFTLEGEIALKLYDAGSTIQLTVTDTGTGIAEEQLPHIFERFHRIEGAAARTHEGTGIGLALVKELVKLHGGTICVESKPGQGSIFTVNIPKGCAHLPSSQIATARQLSSTVLTANHYVEGALRWLPNEKIVSIHKGSDTKTDVPYTKISNDSRPRIIWADDNADMRDYITRLLSSQYEVEAVPDGKAALAAAHRQQPDLILADVMMPLLDGFGLLRAIRADETLCSIPFILLSARAGEESHVEGMAAGADDYLVKPFSARELMARVDARIQIARLRFQKEIARESSERLAMELADVQALHRISSSLIEENNIGELYEQILHAACLLMRSEMAAIQRFIPERNELLLLAHKDFAPESAAFWERVRMDSSSSSVRVMRNGERSILSDIERDDGLVGSKDLDYYRLSGIRAVQSTRLISRSGRFVGILSTHWRNRHQPNERELRLFDVLARQAADLLERLRVQESLKEADKRKDEFLAVLAHELRNPLFPVKNAIYLLQHTKNPISKNQELIQMMERQVNHMVRLVDDLMELSRIATGKIELQKEMISLAEIIDNAIEVSKPLLNSKQHQLNVSLPNEPLLINADMIRMTQVFANLLNNSAKFTPINGVVTVNVNLENNNVVISIKDNGIGISAEMMPKVFEMFTQDKQIIDPNTKGLGIGLAMVRSLVELHEGTVKAYSAGHRQGSEFLVSLPLMENKNEKIEEYLITPEENFSLISLRVLIVDDHFDITNSLSMLLDNWDANVHTVNNGQSALAVIDEFKPHVILLDIGMPDMDGYEVATIIRQNPHYDTIKLVALTGWSQEKDRAKSKACGFDEHLAKPVDISGLKKLLNSLK